MKRANARSRRGFLGLAALGIAGVSAAGLASFGGAGRLVRRSGIAFGTVVSITLVDDGRAAIEPAFIDAFNAIRAIEHAANLFDAQSEICRLNRDGRIDRPSPELSQLVAFALRLASSSDGAYDPTVQPVWAAWQAAKRQGRMPSDAELRRAIELVGYGDVSVERDRIRLGRPDMALTLNSIAQGYATDRALAAVTARGVTHAFIDTGEIGAEGHRPDGGSWRVAIADPRADDRHLGELSLAPRRFVATSADNACHWTPDYAEHHIVEPWSGHSPRELAEVAVVASSGLLADGLSTAAMVSGRERGARLLAAIDPTASAIFVEKAGRPIIFGEELSALA